MKIVDLLLQHNLDYSYESGKFIKSIIFNNNYIIDFDNRPLTNLKFLTGLFEEIDLNNIKFVNINIQTICVLSDLYRNRKNNINTLLFYNDFSLFGLKFALDAITGLDPVVA